MVGDQRRCAIRIVGVAHEKAIVAPMADTARIQSLHIHWAAHGRSSPFYPGHNGTAVTIGDRRGRVNSVVPVTDRILPLHNAIPVTGAEEVELVNIALGTEVYLPLVLEITVNWVRHK